MDDVSASFGGRVPGCGSWPQRPEAAKVARPIERLTRLLRDAGAMAAAGAALIGPLQRIGSWLGTSGLAILHLLN